MVDRRLMRLAAVCLALLVVCTSCGSAVQRPIRLGISPWPGCEFLFLAQERGFFDTCGVDVRIVQFVTPGDAFVAFGHGRVDAVCATNIELLPMVRAFPTRPRVILVMDESKGGDLILGLPSLAGIADLRGKRVAADPLAMGSYVLTRALEEVGMKLTDVELVSMPESRIAEAVGQGRVVAGVAYPPFDDDIRKQGATRLLFDSSRIPGEIFDLLLVDRVVLDRHPGAREGILGGWQKALDFAREQPAEANRVMARREGVTADEFARSLATIRLFTPADQVQYLGPSGRLLGLVQEMEATIQTLRGNDSSVDSPGDGTREK